MRPLKLGKQSTSAKLNALERCLVLFVFKGFRCVLIYFHLSVIDVQWMYLDFDCIICCHIFFQMQHTLPELHGAPATPLTTKSNICFDTNKRETRLQMCNGMASPGTVVGGLSPESSPTPEGDRTLPYFSKLFTMMFYFPFCTS